MTDIVEYLHDSPCKGDIGCAHDLCVAAANEIERLREALRKIEELDIDRSVAQRYRPDGIPSKMDRCNHGIAMYDE